MKAEQITIGNTYRLSGEIENGHRDGKQIITHEEVTRKITSITEINVICECGRKFLINNKLKITEVSHI